MGDLRDQIELRMKIHAPARDAWRLISTPGWFVTLAVEDPPSIERLGAGTWSVQDGLLGSFVLSALVQLENVYAAFLWESAAAGPGGLEPTLIEFWIEEIGGGLVSLKVCESGLSHHGETVRHSLQMRMENIDGWESALAAARDFLEAECRR